MPVAVRYVLAVLGLTTLGGGLIVGTGMLQASTDTGTTATSVAVSKKPSAPVSPSPYSVPVASAVPTANADMAAADFINQGIESDSSIETGNPDPSPASTETDTANTDAVLASQE